MYPADLRFDHGLIPAVVQDATSGRVLMLGYMNRKALQATLETGQAHFWSRSRRKLWRKGATSGNTLAVSGVESDCDADALLIRARPTGPTCHLGNESCFDARTLSFTAMPLPLGESSMKRAAGEEDQGFDFLEDLWRVVADRALMRPHGSYTADLVTQGVDAVGRKVLEETGEVLLAATDGDRLRVAEEAADLLYHLLVLLAQQDVPPSKVLAVLEERRR
jgi:phosphoribosyl-ATP pyrophosphohydrolase/phosphoribosyl-AMP cyclohydrolase